jgi:hypothetical protein
MLPTGSLFSTIHAASQKPAAPKLTAGGDFNEDDLRRNDEPPAPGHTPERTNSPSLPNKVE